MIWLLQLRDLVIFTVVVMLMVPLQVYFGYRFIDYLAEMHVKRKYRK